MKKFCSLILLCLILILNLVFPGCSTVNPTGEISEYVIVTAQNPTEYEQRAAEYIQSKIQNRTGTTLVIANDSAKQVKYEILVGNTNRALSAKTAKTETKGLEFVICGKNGSIALQGDNFVIAAAAYYFVNEYVSETGLSDTIPAKPTVLTPTPQKAKNFFLLIGDGMGEFQTKMIDYLGKDNDIYRQNNEGENCFYGYLLPNQGKVSTYSLSGTTDSAAAGTAMACGYKTYNRYIGKDGNGENVKSITELAVELGYTTAVMSTDYTTGATPATFTAHVLDRFDSMAIMKSQAKMRKTDIICNLNDKSFSELETIIRDELKLFTESTGSFLMYEEAYIDKYCAKNELENAYGALLRFNNAIGVFMEYAMYHPDTMVIITADHETGGLIPNANGGIEFTTINHTGIFVPIFAYGQGSEYFNNTNIQNVDIAKFIARMWGITDFGQ